MHVRAERLHPLIAQQQDAEALQVMRNGHILKLHRSDGHAALEKRQGQPVNVAEVGIAARAGRRVGT